MEYKPETEKVAMMANFNTAVPRQLSPAEDPRIQRVRKVLIIILAVCIALSTIALVSAIFGNGQVYREESARRSAQAGEAVVSIIFYCFGLFAAHRYSEIGLRVFAWFIIVMLVVTGIGLVVLLILSFLAISIAATGTNDGVDQGAIIASSVVVVIFLIAVAAAFIFSAIIVHLSFKLARLIEANKRLIIQQI